MNRKKGRMGILCLAAFVLLSCVFSPSALPESLPDLRLDSVSPTSSVTPTPFRPKSPTPSRTLAATLTPSPTATPTATLPPSPTETPTLTPTPPPPERTQYTLDAALNYDTRTLKVQEEILYVNRSSVPLSELLLAVEPNARAGVFTLKEILLNGAPASYTLKGHRLQISLPAPLAPEETLSLSLSYTLNIPAKRRTEVFGETRGQINLVNWYPFIVPYREGEGWILHNPSGVGEHLVYEAADFDVRFRLRNGVKTLVVAASASAKEGEDASVRDYHLDAARTFVLSISPSLKEASKEVNGIRVTSYFRPEHETAGQAILKEGARAVKIYSRRFAPYPHESLSIVETDLPDGMEYDGLVFMGSSFYGAYAGTPKCDLISIGVHEISHQWWFGLVGNDQALEPWLDEAMAVYSERIFYEEAYPAWVNWWWNYRVYWFSPRGWVDSSIYNGGDFRHYTNAVYLRGAEFLEALRGRIGDSAFNAFLKDYAKFGAHRQVTGRDFFSILNSHTQTDYSDILSMYFQNPPPP